MTHDTQVPACHKRDLPLSTRCLILVDVPELDELVRSTSHEAASDVRGDVERRSGTFVSGERVLGGRGGEGVLDLGGGGERAGVVVKDEARLESDLKRKRGDQCQSARERDRRGERGC